MSDPTYEHWSHRHLQEARAALVRVRPQPHGAGAHVAKIDEELSRRRFLLRLKINGLLACEYDRLRTKADCRAYAERLGLPVGIEVEVNGERWIVEIEPTS